MESRPTQRAAVPVTVVPPAAQAALELLASQRRTCVAIIDAADGTLPTARLRASVLMLLRYPGHCVNPSD